MGVVRVTSSKTVVTGPKYAAKNAADIRSLLVFQTAFRSTLEDIPHLRNNWLCYEFLSHEVILTHYTIRSDCEDNAGVNTANLRSWIVEVSRDGHNWTEADSREDSSELNDRNVTKLFNVALPVQGRFVRLVNVGRNHAGNDSLCLSSFEVFGTLIG
jgi:hypothetical protein